MVELVLLLNRTLGYGVEMDGHIGYGRPIERDKRGVNLVRRSGIMSQAFSVLNRENAQKIDLVSAKHLHLTTFLESLYLVHRHEKRGS